MILNRKQLEDAEKCADSDTCEGCANHLNDGCGAMDDELEATALHYLDAAERRLELLKRVRETLAEWQSYTSDNLQIANWHLNGDLEPYKSFYDDSGTEEAIEAIDKEVSEGEK